MVPTNTGHQGFTRKAIAGSPKECAAIDPDRLFGRNRSAFPPLC
jgi:hypothetical protein